MKKILQLSTYPIINPLHGGQIRVSQIRKYLENHNCEVKSLSLSEMTHMDYTEDDFAVNNNELQSITRVPFCSDYATSKLSIKGKAYQFLKNNIVPFSPDIILLEQVWLWPAVKKLLKENSLPSDVKIIYSSQNIEYITKQSLLNSHDIKGDDVDTTIQEISNLEKELCQNADTVISCTSIDADKFITMGANTSLVCNNGVSRRLIDNNVTQHLLQSLENRKYALFVGSAYPPNALGFWEMMGESLAWLPPDCIILAAGGVSKILENYMPESAKLFNCVNSDKIKKIGFVSEELLSSLLDNASVILLPITIGGGSNLKTAEAIASRRAVVATTTACRGFDITNKLSNFIITNNQNEFINSTLTFLNNTENKVIDEDEKQIRESVFWDNCLKPLDTII